MAERKAGHPGVVISVVGPTASGKTELAIALAQSLGTEIVNADARQVYRGMAIGTAQPTADEQKAAVHHFVDFLEPTELFSAGAFEAQAVPVLSRLCKERGTAILAGGSGMYVKAALEGLDPLPADLGLRRILNREVTELGLPALVARLEKLDSDHVAVLDTSNPQRVVRALEVCLASGKPFSSFHTGNLKDRPWHVVSVGLNPGREELRERIARRTHAMMEAGWLEEARQLLPLRKENALNTVGYKELFQHLEGALSLEEAVQLVITHTRQFAKRQMTWFRKNSATTWFDCPADSRGEVLGHVVAHVKQEVHKLQGTPLPHPQHS